MISELSRIKLGRLQVRSARLLAAATLLTVAACGTGTAGSATPGSSPGLVGQRTTPSAATTPDRSPPQSPATQQSRLSTTVGVSGVKPSKTLVIIEENHSESAALQAMPYLASLSDHYGRTTDYRAVTHPSLPNYLAIAGGSVFDVTDDKSPASHPIDQPSVFDDAIAAGHSAKTYAEAMPEPCYQTPAGTYAVKHNPWAYFSGTQSRANCQQFNVPAGTVTSGALHDDIAAGALPTISLLIPDLCNDAHNCPLSTADNWLREWLTIVMQGPDFTTGDLSIIVTFDEDDTNGPNTVLTTVIAPTINAVVTDTALTHYSLTRYLAELAGVPPPGQAASTTSLATALGI
jgi:acid phosphatase